ncbi:hypothetical protein NBO_403g0004 [Nosema bombycis CQ1]|uniref:Uncharacterized protein n=1 Tax=Nosema bombycis (strain CQ1 / CVCC 102059) TaxID=578461 RepID=R0KQU1_NOSB1|nr:hypothetical protein NBO_403g0004 [Nosema bombycis CQ1]|eukprot:EOB12582.1 hypothetical protein NBO_403g0004 [Nosema bombycis CQ1]
MLKLQKKFVKKELWKHKIVTDVDVLINKMYEDGKINEFMTNETIFTILLINLSLQHPIYKRLLNKNYLYDLEFDLVDKKQKEENFNLTNFDENLYDSMVKSDNAKLSSKIQELTSDILKSQIAYTFVSCMMDRYYVMVKYKDILEDYNDIQKTLEMKLQENKMIKKDFDIFFNEKIINVSKSDLKRKYEELIRHVKAIKLPLQVIDDECFGLSVTYRDIIDVYIESEYSDNGRR